MNGLGKLLIGIGGVLILLGLIVVFFGRVHVPLGKLPGDVSFRGKNTAFFVPITTCIVLSVLLTFILWLISRFKR